MKQFVATFEMNFLKLYFVTLMLKELESIAVSGNSYKKVIHKKVMYSI